VNQTNSQPSLIIRNIIYLSILGGTLGFILIFILAQLSGRGPIGNDARFAEFRVCLDDNDYQPINIIAAETTTIYLCGVIEGHGIRQGYWNLYLNEKMIQGRYLEHFPGIFFERVFFKDGLKSGHYVVHIRSARQVIAKTEFTVIEPE
jgi:hypothetical protein